MAIGARRGKIPPCGRAGRAGAVDRRRAPRRDRARRDDEPRADPMNPLYPLVAARAGHRCEYCRAPEAVFNFPFEVEHILPRSLGGGDMEDNLALACRACNLRKSARVTCTDPAMRRTPGSTIHERIAGKTTFSLMRNLEKSMASRPWAARRWPDWR